MFRRLPQRDVWHMLPLIGQSAMQCLYMHLRIIVSLLSDRYKCDPGGKPSASVIIIIAYYSRFAKRSAKKYSKTALVV
jgi:hypothetical protein